MSGKELERQWIEVQENYPLVARAYKLTLAELKRISIMANQNYSKKFQDAVVAKQVIELDEEMLEVMYKVGMRIYDCIKQFERDVARAEEYDPAISEKFSNCWKNALKP